MEAGGPGRRGRAPRGPQGDAGAKVGAPACSGVLEQRRAGPGEAWLGLVVRVLLQAAQGEPSLRKETCWAPGGWAEPFRGQESLLLAAKLRMLPCRWPWPSKLLGVLLQEQVLSQERKPAPTAAPPAAPAAAATGLRRGRSGSSQEAPAAPAAEAAPAPAAAAGQGRTRSSRPAASTDAPAAPPAAAAPVSAAGKGRGRAGGGSGTGQAEAAEAAASGSGGRGRGQQGSWAALSRLASAAAGAERAPMAAGSSADIGPAVQLRMAKAGPNLLILGY